MTALQIFAIGLAAIVAPPAVTDPAVTYQLQIIDECRPEAAALETRLNQRNWRMDDIGTDLLWRLDRARQALHIAEERLLDLYKMPRRTAVCAR